MMIIHFGDQLRRVCIKIGAVGLVCMVDLWDSNFEREKVNENQNICLLIIDGNEQIHWSLQWSHWTSQEVGFHASREFAEKIRLPVLDGRIITNVFTLLQVQSSYHITTSCHVSHFPAENNETIKKSLTRGNLQ